jgi:hypothetical protein
VVDRKKSYETQNKFLELNLLHNGTLLTNLIFFKAITCFFPTEHNKALLSKMNENGDRVKSYDALTNFLVWNLVQNGQLSKSVGFTITATCFIAIEHKRLLEIKMNVASN